ncbi:MAG: DUF3592 domain-containing protein [Proteobacteria bacterium]|nr:DUF3592 domain-containing protein [Pseudomonadota bacterium]MBU1714953.1 DUF3592 domain-containing protein [Pseudomonadota bacterium]
MKSPRNNFPWFSLALLLAGGALIAASLWTGWLRLESRSWAKTEGVVESVTLDAWDTPQVIYRFNAGGIDYHGSNIKLGLIGPGPEPPAEGEKVIVYFDSEHPENCTLYNSLVWSDLFIPCGIAIVLFILPGIGIYYLRRNVLQPPPDAALSPTPGRVPYQSKAAIEISLGRIGATRLNIEEWQPGNHIRIIQKRTWNLYPIIMAILFISGVFLWLSNLGSDLNLENKQMPFLMWNIFIFLPGLALSWPSRPGSVTFDWANDSIIIRSGRSLRVVGLRRVRAIELRYKSTRSTTATGSARTNRSSSWYQFIVWIESDTGETVPFLFASTRARSFINLSHKDVEGLQQLANSLAVVLEVPCGPLNKSITLFE